MLFYYAFKFLSIDNSHFLNLSHHLSICKEGQVSMESGRNFDGLLKVVEDYKNCLFKN